MISDHLLERAKIQCLNLYVYSPPFEFSTVVAGREEGQVEKHKLLLYGGTTREQDSLTIAWFISLKD